MNKIVLQKARIHQIMALNRAMRNHGYISQEEYDFILRRQERKMIALQCMDKAGMEE